MESPCIRVAGIQIAPVFLDAEKTWGKLVEYIGEAHSNGANLITWGEALIPGYPIWVWTTNVSSWNDEQQKFVYGRYWREAIDLDESRIVSDMKVLAKELKVTFMGGIVEKEGGSLYCTLLTIGDDGRVLGRHRKIKPTFSERLVWADGDALGLKTHNVNGVTVGGLNCWENWLPLARAALHAQGEMLHIAVWPGSLSLIEDVTRFIALEGRSWVLSTSGLLRPGDFDHLDESEFAFKNQLSSRSTNWYNGGSLAADPKGKIVAGPLTDKEGIIYVDVDPTFVVRERQNFDYSGNYSRNDIFNDFHTLWAEKAPHRSQRY